jgi:ADP-ribose pyrophosphatase YjhB (NUDIX family)
MAERPEVCVGAVALDGDRVLLVILDFRVTILSSTPPAAGDDAEQAAWFPLTDIPDLPLVEGLADFFYDHGILPGVLPGSA